MLPNKSKTFAIITLVTVFFNLDGKAENQKIKTLDDFTEFAIQESWRITNNHLDFMNETRWRNEEKFKETVYKIIPQLLLDCSLMRGVFEDCDKDNYLNRELINCGIDFYDKQVGKILTPMDWNYIVFINCLKFMVYDGIDVAFMRLLNRTKYISDDEFSKYCNLSDLCREMQADESLFQLQKALMQTFATSGRPEILPKEEIGHLKNQYEKNSYITLIRSDDNGVEMIGNLLNLASGKRHTSDIIQSVSDMKIYMNQLEIYRYLDELNKFCNGITRLKLPNLYVSNYNAHREADICSVLAVNKTLIYTTKQIRGRPEME